MKPVVRTAVSLAALIGSLAPAAAAERPVVVELFTSQGCSSCPPADAILGELAKQPGLLPLAFHVDYWNRLGWKDPYSSAESTQRQRAYARLLGLRTIYTPQMVVDGRIDVVGSERADVLKAIDAAREGQNTVPIELARDGDGLRVRVGAGENGGRTLTEFNIVRHFDQVGRWQGAVMMQDVPLATLEGAESVALLLQAPDGAVLGAASLDLANGS